MPTSSSFCIVGLGNPGEHYDKTRHNVGFLFLDYLTSFYNASKPSIKNTYSFTKAIVCGYSTILLKPLEYMNLSGRAFSYITHYYKIPLSHCIVCYDDLAFPLGDFRLKANGSSGGHNGLSSIIEHAHTQNFARMRFGIAPINNKNHEKISDFVLSKFKKEELSLLEEVFPKVREILELFLTQGIEKAMNKANTRKSK